MNNVGVKYLDIYSLTHASELKKELLYFDKVIIDSDSIEIALFWLNYFKFKDSLPHVYEQAIWNLNELDYLEKEGLVLRVETSNHFKEIIDNASVKSDGKFQLKGALNMLDKYNKTMEKPSKEIPVEEAMKNVFQGLKNLAVLFNFQIRKNCSILNENEIYKFKPILPSIHKDIWKVFNPLINQQVKSKKTDVIHMVISKFPIPNDNISWEKIIDIRNNEDLNLYRSGLINWINEAGNSSLKLNELEEKFDYLKSSYEDRMKKENMKYEVSNFELIFTTSLEVLENVLKLNISKAAKTIFNLKRRHIDLMIGETKAPGRDIAYLTRLEMNFDDKTKTTANNG